jgi:hypothetical protein
MLNDTYYAWNAKIKIKIYRIILKKSKYFTNISI